MRGWPAPLQAFFMVSIVLPLAATIIHWYITILAMS